MSEGGTNEAGYVGRGKRTGFADASGDALFKHWESRWKACKDAQGEMTTRAKVLTSKIKGMAQHALGQGKEIGLFKSECARLAEMSNNIGEASRRVGRITAKINRIENLLLDVSAANIQAETSQWEATMSQRDSQALDERKSSPRASKINSEKKPTKKRVKLRAMSDVSVSDDEAGSINFEDSATVDYLDNEI